MAPPFVAVLFLIIVLRRILSCPMYIPVVIAIPPPSPPAVLLLTTIL